MTAKCSWRPRAWVDDEGDLTMTCSLMLRSRQSAGVLLALGVLALPQRAAAQSYRLVELQPLAGDTSCTVVEMTNQLQAIGTSGGFDAPRHVRWDANGQPSVLPVPPYTRSLRINNHGEIAGIRGIGPPPPLYPKFGIWPSVPFALIGDAVVDLPAPPNAGLSALRLTDTGILLLNQDYGFLGAGPSWAVYQGTLYQLTVADLFMKGISDNGLFGFNTRSGSPFVQLPGRSPVAPWPDDTDVQGVGPGGHVLGHEWSPDGTTAIRYRAPDGASTRYALGGGTLSTGRMNHAGDVVGRHFTGAAAVFLFRNGQLVDLTNAVPDRRVYDARQITDTGAILASLENSGASCGAYLVPTAPAPPGHVTFAVNARLVTLQWSAAVGAADYIVEAGSAPGLADLYRAAVGASPALTVAAPAGRYYVRVRARNANGESDPSNEIIVDVP